MSYRDKTYIIFDGDNDMWAYGYMKGWDALPQVPFNFDDAHEVYRLNPGVSEETVKRKLRERFALSSQVIVLVGAHTKYLYKYVRWEIEVAQDLDLPIIVVNLNDEKEYDANRCPPILDGYFAVHVPFKQRIIKHALDNFPAQYHSRNRFETGGNLYYPNSLYQSLGL